MIKYFSNLANNELNSEWVEHPLVYALTPFTSFQDFRVDLLRVFVLPAKLAWLTIGSLIESVIHFACSLYYRCKSLNDLAIQNNLDGLDCAYTAFKIFGLFLGSLFYTTVFLLRLFSTFFKWIRRLSNRDNIYLLGEIIQPLEDHSGKICIILIGLTIAGGAILLFGLPTLVTAYVTAHKIQLFSEGLTVAAGEGAVIAGMSYMRRESSNRNERKNRQRQELINKALEEYIEFRKQAAADQHKIINVLREHASEANACEKRLALEKTKLQSCNVTVAGVTHFQKPKDHHSKGNSRHFELFRECEELFETYPVAEFHRWTTDEIEKNLTIQMVDQAYANYAEHHTKFLAIGEELLSELGILTQEIKNYFI